MAHHFVHKCGEASELSEDYVYFSDLSVDFFSMADVELVVEGEHKLPCHSHLLRLHSKVFDGLLTEEAFEQTTSKQQRAGRSMVSLGLTECCAAYSDTSPRHTCR